MNRSQRRATRSGQPAAAWLTLANAEFRRGRLDDAHRLCVRILVREPGHAQALYLDAMIARLQARPLDATTLFTRALASAPDEPAIHDGLAETWRLLERPIDAERHYRRVAELRPGPVTLLNLGNALIELGRPADADSVYRSALRLDARLPELHHALGRALVAQGQPGTEAFARAVALRPDFADAQEDLVNALFPEDAPPEDAPHPALRAVCEALRHADTPRLRVQFTDAVRATPPQPILPGLQRALRRALAERWTRPQDLVRPACDIAALEQAFDPLDPILGLVLELAPICHPAVERALTAQRRSLLESAAAGDTLTADALASAGKLARQCFINEYAWQCTEAEHAHVATLRETIETALDQGLDPSDTQVATIAQYLPLGSLRGAGRLLSHSRPEPLASLLTQQIIEPAEEVRLRGAIRRATAIDDAVSALVRDQYEANPYPRWVATSSAAHRVHLGDWLATRFPNAPLAPMPAMLEVLIAGCGTGQQALDTVRDIVGTDVLAIDLSLASLSYAARMTASLGVEHIDYAQADLLRVAELERSFDLICVGGVLHHLADPWTGWRALLGVLRPGGVMNVLLYTVRGRGDVSRARDWIAARGWHPDPDAIRDCRRDLLACSEDWAVRLCESPDFYSLSGCRDLLFHVQEQPVRLPDISEFLETEGITLLGIEVPQATEQAFLAVHPGSLRDLTRWDLFEAENTGCFAGMVNLWVQKQGWQGSAHRSASRLDPLKAAP